ncbi:hypothetical protein KKF82_06605 [Patescibacteria group bacterium]|nr:hypothetical protein [Patescibacteria group bacterium]
MLIPILKYLILTLKHKWFVFIAGLKIKASIWRLIKHDISKFFPSELPYYGNQFFGKADNPDGFNMAWLRHQNRNDHHWEFYIPRTGHNRGIPRHPDNEPMQMPVDAVKEMVSDWFGASRAYDGKWPKTKNWPWFKNTFDKIKIHPETRKYVLEILNDIK